jgi:uncharacterized repeat protein (TIGR02543 family)
MAWAEGNGAEGAAEAAPTAGAPSIADAPVLPATQGDGQNEPDGQEGAPDASPSLVPLASTGSSVIHVLSDEGGAHAVRKAAVEAKWGALQSGLFTDSNRYGTLPRTTAPYAAGTLKAAVVADALRHLNLVRFLAGLPDDVRHDADQGASAQAGAMLLAASGEFSHFPSRPTGMGQALYDLGYSGTSHSNIAWGYPSLGSAIINGWAEDSDSSNISALGHRRWILNPAMAKTGFGDAAGRHVMYSFDSSRTSDVFYEAIAYPGGQAFPSALMYTGTAWSVTLNPSLYATPSSSTITVRLSNGTDTWSFSKANTDTDGRYFNVETNGYGVPNCIIFRPDGVSSYTGLWKVSVNGIKTKGGDPATLDYQVRFFAFDTKPPALSAASAVRTSTSSATVRFTSNEAGSYYYRAVAPGAAAPTIDTSGAGRPLVASAQTLTLSGLTSPTARDLYLVGKDTLGNVSPSLKVVLPAASHTVTYNANGGKVARKASASVKRAHDSKLGKLPTPSRTGYTFDGWYTRKAGGTKAGATTKVRKAVTYYARWKAKTYTVRLNANGGKVARKASASVKRAHDSKFTRLPTPTRAGHSFQGWYTRKAGGTKVTGATKVTRAVTLYAHWKRVR